jgi:hypothetical protein
LLRVADTLVERRERLAVVEIRSVNRVSGRPELIGEREESSRPALRMVIEQ